MEQQRLWIAVAVAMAIMVLPFQCLATDYTVGDSSGWTLGVVYSTWASGKTFAVGDKLVFKYTPGTHNTLVVNKAAYDSCLITNPLATHSSGNDTITLDSTGANYYICGITGHCSAGMKLTITVGAASTSKSNGTVPSSSPARTVYTVGDSSGWTLGVVYSTWASGKTFAVGDKLVFKYTPSTHNTLVVNKAAYDSCLITNPLATHSSGNDTITLDSTGAKYYICGITGHCSAGMKLTIPVGAASTSKSNGTVPSSSPARTVYTVGDSSGWTLGVVYSTWASGKTFAVGDKLVFKYTPGTHNTLVVNKAAYDSCLITNPLSSHSSGNDTITLDSTGTKYYICGITGHCSAGMKLTITVGAAATSKSNGTARSPSPAPSPTTTKSNVTAPSPSPTPSPSSATPPTPPTPSASSPSPSSATPTTPTASSPSPSSTATPPTVSTPPESTNGASSPSGSGTSAAAPSYSMDGVFLLGGSLLVAMASL